jgi:hypothetical protein
MKQEPLDRNQKSIQDLQLDSCLGKTHCYHSLKQGCGFHLGHTGLPKSLTTSALSSSKQEGLGPGENTWSHCKHSANEKPEASGLKKCTKYNERKCIKPNFSFLRMRQPTIFQAKLTFKPPHQGISWLDFQGKVKN